MPLYLFTHRIFDALKTTGADKDGEVQLTDAIQKLVDKGHKVQAIELAPDDLRFDIGTPETYWETLNLSYHYALSLRKDTYAT
jgi:UTP-glucose-1-phosphate uridylyltransferase